MTELAQHTRLDLADALAGDTKLAPDFLQRTVATSVQAVAQLNDLALTLGQLIEHDLDLLAQDALSGTFERRRAAPVFDKVGQHRVALGTNRRLKRYGLSGSVENTSDLIGRD